MVNSAAVGAGIPTPTCQRRSEAGRTAGLAGLALWAYNHRDQYEVDRAGGQSRAPERRTEMWKEFKEFYEYYYNNKEKYGRQLKRKISQIARDYRMKYTCVF